MHFKSYSIAFSNPTGKLRGTGYPQQKKQAEKPSVWDVVSRFVCL